VQGAVGQERHRRRLRRRQRDGARPGGVRCVELHRGDAGGELPPVDWRAANAARQGGPMKIRKRWAALETASSPWWQQPTDGRPPLPDTLNSKPCAPGSPTRSLMPSARCPSSRRNRSSVSAEVGGTGPLLCFFPLPLHPRSHGPARSSLPTQLFGKAQTGPVVLLEVSRWCCRRLVPRPPPRPSLIDSGGWYVPTADGLLLLVASC